MEGIHHPPELRGIIPNAFDHIFTFIRSAKGIKFLVRASYLEIYNEDIRDLLADTKRAKLELKEHPEYGVYVKDLRSFVVKDVDELEKLMQKGNQLRSVGETQMNAKSSRSHSIFTTTIEMSEMKDGKECIRVGKLHLVDLAGSERQSKTGAQGDRLKEAAQINLSLSCLGNVIKALVDGKSSHVPYRDSKLTRILQDSLGGSAKTMMMATVSPASFNYEETLSTLRYASRAKNIKNKPKINEDPKDAMLRQFQQEIDRLRAELEAKSKPPVMRMVSDGPMSMSKENNVDSLASTITNNLEAVNAMAPSKKKKLPLASDETELATMESMIQKEKKAMLQSKDAIEQQKSTILAELQKKQEEMDSERVARDQLVKQIEDMESQLLVGGVNILDKEAQQREELARHQAEFENHKREKLMLEEQVKKEEVARLQMEEEYTSLQEEVTAKTQKIKKLWALWMEQKAEIQDLTQEFQREREGLLDDLRYLSKDLKLKWKLVERLIPEKELLWIESQSTWDELNEIWHIEHIHLAGSSVSTATSKPLKTIHVPIYPNPNLYLTYDPIMVPNSAKTIHQSSPTSSSKVRPQAARSKSGIKYRGRSLSSAPPCTQNEPPPSARGLVSKPKHYA
ncbi:Kinesin-like protein kif3a [Coelomomyces lativittatus]|nr:Kinesin-like protein kif3a [Coelomomyces lativittatus]